MHVEPAILSILGVQLAIVCALLLAILLNVRDIRRRK